MRLFLIGVIYVILFELLGASINYYMPMILISCASIKIKKRKHPRLMEPIYLFESKISLNLVYEYLFMFVIVIYFYWRCDYFEGMKLLTLPFAMIFLHSYFVKDILYTTSDAHL